MCLPVLPLFPQHYSFFPSKLSSFSSRHAHFVSFTLIFLWPSSSCHVSFFLSPPLSSSSVSFQVQPVVSRSSLATVPCGVSREEEAGRSHSTKKGAFHEIFNLQESERPLSGEGTYCSIKNSNMDLLWFLEIHPFGWKLENQLKSQIGWEINRNFCFMLTSGSANIILLLSVLCVFSVWERLAMLPHKQRQEDADRLHQKRSALRHREVSGTSSLRREFSIIVSQTAQKKSTYSFETEQRGGTDSYWDQCVCGNKYLKKFLHKELHHFLCLCVSESVSGSSRTALLLRISLIQKSPHLFLYAVDKKSIQLVFCFAFLLVFFLSRPLSASCFVVFCFSLSVTCALRAPAPDPAPPRRTKSSNWSTSLTYRR